MRLRVSRAFPFLLSVSRIILFICMYRQWPWYMEKIWMYFIVYKWFVDLWTCVWQHQVILVFIHFNLQLLHFLPYFPAFATHQTHIKALSIHRQLGAVLFSVLSVEKHGKAERQCVVRWWRFSVLCDIDSTDGDKKSRLWFSSSFTHTFSHRFREPLCAQINGCCIYDCSCCSLPQPWLKWLK